MAKTPMSDCTYSPQINPGNPFITPPSSSPPTLTPSQTVTFTYPYVSPTLTIVLPSPEFNNRDVNRIERITRETRGRTLRTFRYSIWPKIRRLALSFQGIDLTVANNMKTFLLTSIGKEVGYLDYESRQWKGLIINPDSAISQEGRDCTFAIRIDFEGDLV